MCFLPSTWSCTHKYTCGKIIKRTTELPTAINVETGTPSERSFSVQKTKNYLRDTCADRVLRAPHWAGSNGPPRAIAPTHAMGKRRERHRKEIAEKKRPARLWHKRSELVLGWVVPERVRNGSAVKLIRQIKNDVGRVQRKLLFFGVSRSQTSSLV